MLIGKISKKLVHLHTDDVLITKLWDNCIDFQVTSYGKNKEKFCDDYHLMIIFFLYPIAYVNDLEKEYLRLKESKENV